MSPDTPPSLPAAPEYKDRKLGLVIFGGLLALFGVVFLLRTWNWFEWPPQFANNPPILISHSVVGVLMVWLGVGSILARRWARVLMWMLSWMGVGLGALLVFWSFSKPFEDEELLAAMLVGGCIYGVLALISALFYSSKNVKATCVVRDPVERWTDRLPVPVLVLMLGMTAWAFMMFLIVGYGVVLFVQGAETGPPSLLPLLHPALRIAVYGCAAWGLFRLRPYGWWAAFVALAVLPFVKNWAYDSQAFAFDRGTVVWALIWAGLLLIIRKHFKPRLDA